MPMTRPTPLYQLLNDPEQLRRELVLFGYEEICDQHNPSRGVLDKLHFTIDRYPQMSHINVVLPHVRKDAFLQFQVQGGRVEPFIASSAKPSAAQWIWRIRNTSCSPVHPCPCAW